MISEAYEYPVHIAAQHGRCDIVLQLIQDGYSVRMHNHDNQTALHEACFAGHIDCVQILLDHGVEVHFPNLTL